MVLCLCVMSNESVRELFHIYIIFLSITIQIPQKCPATQNVANNLRHRHKKEKKCQGRPSEKSGATARKI